VTCPSGSVRFRGPLRLRYGTWFQLGLLSFLWGAAYLLIELALRAFEPTFVVLARVVLAAVVLVPLAVKSGALSALRRHPFLMVGTAVAQSTAPLLLLTFGQRDLSAGLTGILIGAQPLFVAVLAVRLDPSERPQGIRGALGLLLGFAGLVFLFGTDIDGGRSLLGGALVTVAAVSYAVGSLLIHRKLTFAKPLGVAAAATLVSSSVLLVPGLLCIPRQSPPVLPVVALLVLGVLCTGFTLTLFYSLIANAGPAHVALAFYLSPGVAIILSALLLDEPLTVTKLAGLVAIVAGSALAANRVRVEA
jgi:drug/metabolite transporter (DMT)-like permease